MLGVEKIQDHAFFPDEYSFTVEPHEPCPLNPKVMYDPSAQYLVDPCVIIADGTIIEHGGPDTNPFMPQPEKVLKLALGVAATSFILYQIFKK